MLQDHIGLVKGQIDYYQGQIDRFPPSNPRRQEGQVELYRRILNQHKELLTFLETLAAQETAVPFVAPKSQPAKADDDLSDLPEELLQQLSVRAKKGQNDPFIQIINDRGGTASLDDMLIDLYRKHREISSRGLLANKLYRLAKQGLIKATEGKKGVYTTVID